MKTITLGLTLLILSASFLTASLAQAPVSPNADIVKMIQAGLPESTVVNKIREGAGRWDTSVDALILLKQIGATAEELDALTSESKPPVAQGPTPRVVVMEGFLENQDGDISYFFPGRDPSSAMRFHLELVDGQPALRLYTPCSLGKHFAWGDVLITREKATVSLYGTYEDKTKTIAEDPAPHEVYVYPMAGLEFRATYFRDSYYLMNGPKKDKDQKHFNLPLGMNQYADGDAPSVRFFRALLADFDSTMGALLRGAGVSDPQTQIVASARFQSPAEPSLATRLTASTTEVRFFQAEEKRAILAYKNHQSGGGDALTFANVLQGVSNMQQAVQSAKVADLNHNTAGQIQAATNATTAEVQTLGAVSGNTTTIQPAAPQTAATLQPQPKNTAPSRMQNPQGFTYKPSHGQAPSQAVASNTGTVAPANCVAVNVEGPCIPLSQYHPTQQQASGQGICPASGFVPGVMLRKESDAAVGVPCKPGTPYGPLIATTASGGYTGVTPPDPATGTSGSIGAPYGSSGGGGGLAGHGPIDPNLDSCIGYAYNKDNYLVFTNNCTVAAHVLWYASQAAYGGVTLAPGASDNTYNAYRDINAAGGFTLYACPSGDYARKSDGSPAETGVNNSFACAKN